MESSAWDRKLSDIPTITHADIAHTYGKYTSLEPRLSTEDCHAFASTIGTPQGDSLSPVLFTVYVEAALRDLRSRAILRYSFCRGRDILNIRPLITLSILPVENS